MDDKQPDPSEPPRHRRAHSEAPPSSEPEPSLAALLHDATEAVTAIRNYAAACNHLIAAEQHEQISDLVSRITEQTDRASKALHHMRELAVEVHGNTE